MGVVEITSPASPTRGRVANQGVWDALRAKHPANLGPKSHYSYTAGWKRTQYRKSRSAFGGIRFGGIRRVAK